MYPYDDPDAPGQGDMYGGYQTRSGSPEEVQRVLDLMSQDPRVMQAARSGKQSNLESVFASHGLNLPRHHVIEVGPSGRLELREQGWWERSWPSVGILGGIGAAGAIPALMGAGGSAAAGAGGVGIGETGAVSGLAGSGFGTGGGIGFSAVPGVAGAAGAAGGAAAGGGGLAGALGGGVGEMATRLGTAAGMMGLGQLFGPDQPEIPPELQEMLSLQTQRFKQQQPLYDSILRLAQSRLPVSAQQGPMASQPTQDAVTRLAQRGRR